MTTEQLTALADYVDAAIEYDRAAHDEVLGRCLKFYRDKKSYHFAILNERLCGGPLVMPPRCLSSSHTKAASQ